MTTPTMATTAPANMARTAFFTWHGTGGAGLRIRAQAGRRDRGS